MPVPPPHNPEAGKGFDKGGIRAGPFRRRGFTSDSEENIYQMGELLPSEGQDGGRGPLHRPCRREEALEVA